MGNTTRIGKKKLVERMKLFLIYILSFFDVCYLVIRYGLKGARRKVDAELADVKKEFEVLLKRE